MSGELRPWVEQVRPEWIDYNGHLNDAQYVGVFSRAIDDVMVQVGMDADYLTRTGTSLFTLETHVRYLDQVLADARLHVTCQVIGVAAKVVWLWFEMESDGRLRATMEALMMHVDTAGGCSAAMPDGWTSRPQALKVDPPEHAGRSIRVG